MGNIFINPEMFVFYCFGIILPAIMLLYTIGNLVYTAGEIIEANKQVPLVFLQMIIEYFILLFAWIVIYFMVCDNKIAESLPVSVSIVLWGFLISFDAFLISRINKMLLSYSSKNNQSNFNIYLKETYIKMFQNFKLIYTGKILVIIALAIFSVMSMIWSPPIYVLPMLFVVYCFINYNIFQTINKIKNL